MKLNLVRGEGAGTPVFFQHGLCGSAGQTREVFPADPRFRLHTLECRGHGASETGPYTDFSIKTFADDVAQRIKSPCIVGGISMGSAMALHLAIHRPDLVKALVLARPAWITANNPDNMKPNAEIGRLLATHSPERAKAIFLESETARHLAESAPDNLVSLSSFFSREPIDVTSALLTSISRDGPGVTKQQVRALKIPTLIIATGQDHIHPISHAHALHDLIDNSRLVEITPKGVDKSRYVSEFQSTLLKFFEENT